MIDYFAGFEPYSHWSRIPIINAGLQASVAGGKIVKRYKRNIELYIISQEFFNKVNAFVEPHTRLGFETKSQNLIRFSIRQICNKTEKCPGVIVFPPGYFESPFLHHDRNP